MTGTKVTPSTSQTAISASHDMVRNYSIGFALSIILTLIPFAVVSFGLLNRSASIALLFGFAVVQLYVQLRFFLHMGQGKDTKWNLAALAFMMIVVVIVVFGSLWIMNHLNYNMMPHEQEQQLLEEERIQRP